MDLPGQTWRAPARPEPPAPPPAEPVGPSPPARRRAAPGLRLRLTVLCTVLAALVSALLVWLGWLLVGGVVSAVPALPPGATVRVRDVPVPAETLGRALADAARADVLRTGLVAFPLVVATAAVLSYLAVGHVLRPLRQVTATARRLSAESLDERI